ncbi:MAG: 23S rRNA (pseudouridine(1915)-N(3))-methyltransferase RlmH [Halothermotrichaceae bacterium]
MKTNIITVGSIKKDYLQLGINDFVKRLQPYAEVNIIELSDERISGNLSRAEKIQIIDKEGERILNHVSNTTYIIALDVKGKPMTSRGLAKSIQNLQVQGYSSITFIIGGALGISDKVLKQANYNLSLSHMTFTHQMVRLILIEQVYRAFKIIRGEPYHI